MPSPLGHVLAGFAFGWAAAPDACRAPGSVGPNDADRRGRRAALLLSRWRWPIGFAAAGMAADLDLLVGLHSRYTHSLGAVLLVFLGAWVALRPRGFPAARAALAVALAYASHVLIDWLGSDTAPPLGIMALWPFSSEFYLSPLPIFMGISRKYWLTAAWAQNTRSVLRELAILVPLAGLVSWWRGLPMQRLSGWQKLRRPAGPTPAGRKSTYR